MRVSEDVRRRVRELRPHDGCNGVTATLFVYVERVALEWTQALTRLSARGVPDDIYAKARAQFSGDEMIYLTYMVMVINAWNRASIAFQSVLGSQDKAFGLDKAGLS